MENKKLVEHYHDHEISCYANSAVAGWRYTVSVVLHTGDDSELLSLESDQIYPTDLEALRAGVAAGRDAIDARTNI